MIQQSFFSRLFVLVATAAGCATLLADWSQVTALDLPVTKLSPNPVKAKSAMTAHFEEQITVNEAFLKEFPNDPHAFESRVRLAVAQARLASLQQDSHGVDAALSKLIELEKNPPDETQHAETMFRRISLQWQNLGSDPDQRRDRAVTSALSFSQEFPKDRRAPRLLAEAASLCDSHPEEKRKLVEKALSMPPTASDESLKKRLADDLKRINQLGKPVSLTFQSSGRTVDVSQYHGKVVAIVFWAAESAPCLVWIRDFAGFASDIPDLKVVGVSLDQDRNDLDDAKRSLKIDWPNAFDGKGWQNSIARDFGINALPTLWLLDRQGRLQSLNARDNYQLKINELLRKN